MLENTSRTDSDDCRRCGRCCRRGGPALHVADLDLIRTGVIDLEDLVTLRAGEPVLDQPRGLTLRLEEEIVKVQGADRASLNAPCRFYLDDGAACAIYDSRPAECRALLCSDTAGLADMYERDRLGREDILPPGHPLLELVREQEEHCPAGRAVDLAQALLEADMEAGPAQELADQLAPLAAWDRQVRLALAAKAPAGLPALARAERFLLGRPLREILAPLGLDLAPDGRAVRPRNTKTTPSKERSRS